MADDLCQAAVERALRAREDFTPGTRLDSWTYRILRNLWIDEGRHRQRWQTVALEEAPAAAGSCEPVVETDPDARLDIAAAMERLPPEQREVVALVLVEGQSYREAAEILGLPMGTVTSRLVRGRQALARMIAEETNGGDHG